MSDIIREIEKETKHDVIAFTRTVSESLGEEKKWVHYGLTSTDVVDTANGILLKKANEIIKKDLDNLISVLKGKAIKYKNTPIIGRTHGIHADVTTFGLKWALWYDEMIRNKKYLKMLKWEKSVVQLVISAMLIHLFKIVFAKN